MKKTKTKRVKLTLEQMADMIRTFQKEFGYSPSDRELMVLWDLASPSAVHYRLERLEEANLIQRNKNTARGIRLPDSGRTHSIPILGRIFASQPIEVPESDLGYTDYEYTIEVAASSLPAKDVERLFALEVRGDSMIDAMVKDGDIVILKPSREQTPHNGGMYAFWLTNENTTTLKTYRRDENNKRIWLEPANPTLAPIPVDDPESLEVRGEVVLVIRPGKNHTG